MKKLMFAALAVAGMSAVAAEFTPVAKDFKAKAAEKITLTLKQVTDAKLESVKFNGFIFWDNEGNQKVCIWDKNSKKQITTGIPQEVSTKASKKPVNLKKVAPLVDLGAYSFDYDPSSKKPGKWLKFGENYQGYGSGSLIVGTDTKIIYAKESISGNIVSIKDKQYGTWKMSIDNGAKKLFDKEYSVMDILIKNKVEFWEGEVK